jgi:hypothetical protein
MQREDTEQKEAKAAKAANGTDQTGVNRDNGGKAIRMLGMNSSSLFAPFPPVQPASSSLPSFSTARSVVRYLAVASSLPWLPSVHLSGGLKRSPCFLVDSEIW